MDAKCLPSLLRIGSPLCGEVPFKLESEGWSLSNMESLSVLLFRKPLPYARICSKYDDFVIRVEPDGLLHDISVRGASP